MRERLLTAVFGILLVATSFVAPGGRTIAKSVEDNPGAEPEKTTVSGLANFDIRRDPETRVINGMNVLPASKRQADRSAELDALKAEVPTSNLDDIKVYLLDSGLPQTIATTQGFLTAAQVGSPETIAREYLARHAGAWGLTARDLRNLRLTVNNPDDNIGVTYLKFEQTYRGVPVFDSEIGVTVTARGEIATVTSAQHIPGVRVSTKATLSPEDAIARAFAHCGVEIDPSQVRPSAAKRIVDSSEFTFYASPLGEGHEDVMFQKTIVNVRGDAVLAYRAYVDVNGLEWYDTLVDANTGELLVRYNIVSDVQGQVFTSSPGISAGGSRTTVQFAPLFGVTDPWVGSGTVSTGNNANSYLDRDANNVADSTTTAATGTNPGLTSGHADTTKGTPSGEFTFSYSSSTAPTSQQANAVTNLWYFNNYMHDWMYSLGFTESARNFQTNNFGRGGSQNDAVNCEAQDGSGTNNANFSTPADGSPGRMQQYIFTTTTPNRDSDLDGDVVMHEYGHGVSNRLIGNGSGLGGTQSGAMGEGWSDYWACSNYNDGVMGEYVVNSSAGIRRAPYSVPANSQHDSYADVGNTGFEVHDDGEVWAAALWDLYVTLGKTKTDLLVLNGMKNTPSSPSMVAARSGIVTACNTLYPADVCTVWTVFARHGFGNSASGNDGTSHVAATDLPASCGGGGGGCSSSTTAISAGSTLSGSLASTDCTSTVRTGGMYYDNFTFSATAGTTYTITMTSTAFDTYLHLLNSGGTSVAFDDDGNGGTNSKITYTPSASGTYTIHATSYSAGATGSYSVALASSGGGGGGTELLTNGGFDTGAFSPWVAATYSTIITSAPQAGTNCAKMLGRGVTTSTNFYQSVGGFNGTTKTLRFYLKMSSAEGTSTAYDYLYVRLKNTSGTTVSTLATYTNRNKTTYASWTLVTLTVPSSAASNYRIAFDATEDSSLQTTFNIDSVSVQ